MCLITYVIFFLVTDFEVKVPSVIFKTLNSDSVEENGKACHLGSISISFK